MMRVRESTRSSIDCAKLNRNARLPLHLKQIHQLPPHTIDTLHIAPIAQPQRDAVGLWPCRNDCARHFVVDVELFADQGEGKPHPAAVEQGRIDRGAGEGDGPLAAVGVGRILPHGLDSVLEEVVVGV